MTDRVNILAGLLRRVGELERLNRIAIMDDQGGGGNVSAKNFNPVERMVDDHGEVNLSKSQKGSRIPLTANLPVQATTLIDNREYYLANRVTFVAADWETNELKLFVPAAHIIYTEYVDDKPPIVEVYERTGAAGSYVYTKVSIEFTATYGFLVGKLVGSTLAHTIIIDWQAVTDGEFAIDIDGTRQEVTGINFTTASTMALIAAAISAGITGATCTWDTDHFIITSDASSEYSDVSYVKSLFAGEGTDIAGLGFMACKAGQPEAARTLGQDGTWMVTLTKDTEISAFDGLIEVG